MADLSSANEHYKRIHPETLNNENMEGVEEAIAEVDKLIKENQTRGKATSTLSKSSLGNGQGTTDAGTNGISGIQDRPQLLFE